MTRDELTAIADAVMINWGIDLGGDRRKAFYRTWWRYLGDLDSTSVQGALDRLILADKPFAPRAGTIRRMVMSDLLSDVLTVDLAWAQAVERIRAVQQGTWTTVAPLVGLAMERSAVNSNSKDDREAFVRAWRTVVEEFELEVLGIPPEGTSEG